jgi:hypothetical protein
MSFSLSDFAYGFDNGVVRLYFVILFFKSLYLRNGDASAVVAGAFLYVG